MKWNDGGRGAPVADERVPPPAPPVTQYGEGVVKLTVDFTVAASLCFPPSLCSESYLRVSLGQDTEPLTHHPHLYDEAWRVKFVN